MNAEKGEIIIKCELNVEEASTIIGLIDGIKIPFSDIEKPEVIRIANVRKKCLNFLTMKKKDGSNE